MLSFFVALSNMLNGKKQNKLPPIVDRLLLQPAHKLSSQIKDGSLTSVKLCELYTERIKQVNPLINAMTQDRFSEALETARTIDELLASFRAGKPEAEFSPSELEMLHSPLLGVPISVKESIMVKGMKNTCGLWARRDSVANEDAVVVKNVERFGMIPICTTNVPEGTMFWADCHNKVYGKTVNPYDLSRVTGASSGGEGSLIGAGASVIGIGSDIGGSLRLPAHCCGIFSHKSSPFLLSTEGNYPKILKHRLRLFAFGPMTRYAADLRPLLKCLMSDKDNSMQDTYFKFQPENIAALRQSVMQKLDEPVDISQLKIYYCNFNESQLKGKHSIHVNPEFMDVQREIVDHFQSKFNCRVEQINLDKYLKKTPIIWQCMLLGGNIDNAKGVIENDLKSLLNIENGSLELLKFSLGASKHTKEAILATLFGTLVPQDRQKAFSVCQKFEKLGSELKSELEAILGDSGVLIMPTLPNLAYKHNVALLKTPDLRFTSLFNYLQLPVTHATIRLDKKHKLPFGFSIASKSYNDSVTLAMAEEIELAFGGWVQPTVSPDLPVTGKVDQKEANKTTVYR